MYTQIYKPTGLYTRIPTCLNHWRTCDADRLRRGLEAGGLSFTPGLHVRLARHLQVHRAGGRAMEGHGGRGRQRQEVGGPYFFRVWHTSARGLGAGAGAGVGVGFGDGFGGGVVFGDGFGGTFGAALGLAASGRGGGLGFDAGVAMSGDGAGGERQHVVSGRGEK